jgi:hypothetical protein
VIVTEEGEVVGLGLPDSPERQSVVIPPADVVPPADDTPPADDAPPDRSDG